MKRLTLFLLFAFAASITACNREADVAMLPKLKGIPYFNACRDGARKAAAELGLRLEYDGPDTADSNKQIEMVNAWILRGVKVIAAAPNNPEAIAPVLEKARARGVRVITWDTDARASAREFFCNQVAFEELARTLVNLMVESTGPKARTAIISGTETAANQNTYMKYMRAYVAQRYPEFELMEPVLYPGENQQKAYEAAQGLLRRSDRPDGIFGITTVSCPAAAKAVHDLELDGKVAVTGITVPSAMRQHVRNGTVKKFLLWKPDDLGYLTVYTAHHLLKKNLLQDSTEIDAGTLGKLEIRDGEIVLGPALVFDKDNIDDYAF